MKKKLSIKIKYKEQGNTIISMGIGVLISLLAILGTIATYKMIGKISLDVNQDMNRDSQVLSSLQLIEMEALQSGFGTNTSTSLEQDFTISSNGKKFAWRYKPDLFGGTVSCKGLWIQTQTDQNKKQGIYLYEMPNCNDSQNSAIWEQKPQQIADEKAFLSSSQDIGGYSFEQTFFIKGSNSTCLPYQSDLNYQTEHPVIFLSSQGKNLLTLCLINITLP